LKCSSTFYGINSLNCQKRVEVLPDPTSFKRNAKTIRENQGEMGSSSKNIAGKIREFCLEIAVATLLSVSKCHLFYYLDGCLNNLCEE